MQKCKTSLTSQLVTANDHGELVATTKLWEQMYLPFAKSTQSTKSTSYSVPYSFVQAAKDKMLRLMLQKNHSPLTKNGYKFDQATMMKLMMHKNHSPLTNNEEKKKKHDKE